VSLNNRETDFLTKYSCLPITAKDKQEHVYQDCKITVQTLLNLS